MPEPSEDLVQQIGREVAEWQHATQSFDEAVATRLGTNLTDQRWIMAPLLRDGPTTLGRLSEASGLTPGAITTALDRMETAGYVKRVRDTTDRRRVFAELTPKACEAMGAAWGPLAEESQAALREFSTDELIVFLRVIRCEREIQEAHTARLRAEASDD